MLLPVLYLHRDDFMKTSSGELILKGFDKNDIVVIMVQGGFCGYCTRAKPDYLEFASRMAKKSDVYTCTIQIDNEDCGEFNDLRDILFKQGVPSYIAFKGGRLIGEYTENSRSCDSLVEFVKNIKRS